MAILIPIIYATCMHACAWLCSVQLPLLKRNGISKNSKSTFAPYTTKSSIRRASYSTKIDSSPLETKVTKSSLHGVSECVYWFSKQQC